MTKTRLAALVGVSLIALAAPAAADKFKRPIAVLAGLDKITGRIISFEVGINETVQFGSLQITPRVCYNRPPTEAPRTDAFAEVDEVQSDKSVKRIFSGWMFADSPGLHGVEHPVYDLWLTACKGDGQLIKEAPEVEDTSADDPPDPNATATPTPGATPKPVKTKRPRPKPAPEVPPRDFAPDPTAPAAPLHIGR